jgi:glutamate synthase (NADPH/NADH) small chain
MDFLTQANRVVAGERVETQISAEGKNVVILGGGDTGADCLGTATRQGALSVTTLAIGKMPPEHRTDDMPWPTVPNVFEVQSAHEEFGERRYLHSTVEFVGEDGILKGVKVADTEFVDGKRVPKPGTERIIPADLPLATRATSTSTLRNNLELQSMLETWLGMASITPVRESSLQVTLEEERA